MSLLPDKVTAGRAGAKALAQIMCMGPLVCIIMYSPMEQVYIQKEHSPGTEPGYRAACAIGQHLCKGHAGEKRVNEGRYCWRPQYRDSYYLPET